MALYQTRVEPKPSAPSIDAVEHALRRLYIAPSDEPGRALRDEDRKKVREVTAVLEEVARIGRRRVVVEAASGHAYAGLLAAQLCPGIEALTLIEREPDRVAHARAAAERLGLIADVKEGDVDDAALWPEEPDLVIGLHACGPASDAIVEMAIAKEARWLLLVPCCYAKTVAFSASAEARAEAIGIPRQAPIRRAFIEALIDAERTLRLEAAGYEVTVRELVPRSVSGHNLLWRCRKSGEAGRMAAARAQLGRLSEQ